MSQSRAQEIIESAACRTGFGPKDKAATCEAIVAGNAAVVGRKTSILEAFRAGLVEEGTRLFVEVVVVDTEPEDYDGSMPVEIEDIGWVSGCTEVIIPNA